MLSYKKKQDWKKSTKSWKSFKNWIMWTQSIRNDLSKGYTDLQWRNESRHLRDGQHGVNRIETNLGDYPVSFLPNSTYQWDWTCVNATSGFDPIKIRRTESEQHLQRLKTPYCRTSVTHFKRKEKWSQPMATRSSKNHGCKKRSAETQQIHLYTGPKTERRRNTERLNWYHGSTDERVKYLDYISKIPTSVMMHLTDSDYDMKAQSTWEASIPINKQDRCVNDLIFNHRANALVSLQRAQGKGVPQIPVHLRTRQNNTLDPKVQQHLEWLSFKWKTYFSSSSFLNMDRKPQRGGVLHLCDHQWQVWHSHRVARQRMVEISDNNDNARATHRQVFKDTWYGDARAKRSQMLSSSPESRVHL